MTLLKLFLAFLQVGLFTIGGGYAALPVIQEQAVETYGWLTAAEFTDLITISQMTPGPIGINAATFVGTRIAGLPGAIVATVGCITAPCLIVLTLSVLYKKFGNIRTVRGILTSLHPAVVGLIASAAFTIVLHALFPLGVSLKGLDIAAVVLVAAGVFVLRKFKVNQIFVMLAAGAVGGLFYSLVGML
jgi:chromate transporter